MSAITILCIPNPKHVQRVLRARVALRIVPPSEGVWRCDSDRSGEAGETTKIGSTVGESAGLQGIAQSLQPQEPSP